ncbi:uncharacterized protein LOC144147054 isoform X3 [Haemaphysalis longicornis]
MGPILAKEGRRHERCPGLRINKFRPGDYVAIASRTEISRIHVHGSRYFDTSSCFETIGTVEKVTATSNVEVIFGENIACTIEADALVKVRNLWRGDLVKLVEDIRGDGNAKFTNDDISKQQTQDIGRFFLVSESSDPLKILVIGEKDKDTFSTIHLDSVASLLYGEFRKIVANAACDDSGSPRLTGELLAVLPECIQDLPCVLMFASSNSSPYAPGDVVKISNEVIQFVQRYTKQTVQMSPGNALPDVVNECSEDDNPDIDRTEISQFAAALDSLLQPGKVVDVNSDGDVIVESADGPGWCIQSRFLQPVDSADACSEGTRTSHPKKVSEAVDYCIRHALTLKEEELRQLCLHAACFAGNMDLFQQSLLGNIAVDSEDLYGNKPLHYAAQGNQPEMIKFLLSKGANINATNKNHHTALQFAVKLGFVDCVRELTNHPQSLNPNIQDDSENTALHVAIAKRNGEIINELVTLPKVDFNVTNKYGLTTLHVAALKGNAAVVEKILSKGYHLVNHRQEAEGYTALHFAASSGHYSVVQTLLMQDTCMVDLENKYGATALLLAAGEGHWDIVEMLLFAGANVNKADRQGNTPLHMSLMKAKERLTKSLPMPTSPAMKAVEKKLLQYDPTGVNDRLRLPCFLARSGADIRHRNKQGTAPLELASSLKQPALELLGFFHVERRNADIEKCKVCLEANANTSFKPCGHCLYCDDCGIRMKRCLNCGQFIAERVLTGPNSTFNPENETIEASELRLPMVMPQVQVRGPSGCSYKLQVVPAEELKTGPKIYSMTRNPRGRCIILNNVHFDSHSESREGSELDVDRMHALFTQFHFEVTIESNLSAMDMKAILEGVSKEESQKDADCLVVILMSHGKEGTIYGSDGEEVHLEPDVYGPFNNCNCRTLQGKPKLFFIQACRGDQWDNGIDDVRETSDTSHGADEDSRMTSRRPSKRMPGVSDMYIAYATIPGYVALKNKQIGSWFLSAVSEVFTEHACTTSLDGLMERVHEKVMSYDAHDGSKQTPSVSKHGWRMGLFFNPGIYVQ